MATKKNGGEKTSGTPKVPGKPRNKKNVIPVGNKSIDVYASPRISRALDEITEDMTLYHGVRLAQILEAVYHQGEKDGARRTFGELDKKIKEAQKAIPHRNPGKPKKPK